MRFITWTACELEPPPETQLCTWPPHVSIEVARALGVPTVEYDVIPVSEVNTRMATVSHEVPGICLSLHSADPLFHHLITIKIYDSKSSNIRGFPKMMFFDGRFVKAMAMREKCCISWTLHNM